MAAKGSGHPWLQLAVLCAVPLVGAFANAMLVPVLPEMGRALDVPRSAAGLAITAYALVGGLLIPVAGFLSDRFGRKTIVAPALALFAAGALVTAVSGWWMAEHGFPMVLAGRVIQGLGAAGMGYITMAFVGDLFHGEDRVSALGILEASGGLGKVISPIAGALIGELLAWWGIFFLQAAVALAAALGVWLLTRDPGHHRRRPPRQYIGTVMQVLKQKGSALVACLGLGLVNQFVLVGVLFFLSQHLETDHAIYGVAKGWLLMWPLLLLSLLSFGSGLFLQRHYSLLKLSLLIGLVIMGAGSLLMAVDLNEPLFYLGVLLVGGGSGLQLPALNDLITSASPPSERGGITALYGTVRFIGTAIGPPLFGWMMAASDSLPFWLSTIIAALSTGAALLLVKPERLAETEPGPPGGSTPPGTIPEWQIPTDLPEGTRVRP